MTNPFARFVVLPVLWLAQALILLVIELVAAMLVYIYLNLFHLETFGALVRLARDVLDIFREQFEYWLPTAANPAYATLLGELGPKSILLLLIGLVVATVIRSLARALRASPLGAHRPSRA
ncbi:MAG TPA: hypothetical protein VNK52_07140 [Hyphomicrobiaceae bacterium]|nr:hypothetical protein [Hyphomicrobiaceae bacterium]